MSTSRRIVRRSSDLPKGLEQLEFVLELTPLEDGSGRYLAEAVPQRSEERLTVAEVSRKYRVSQYVVRMLLGLGKLRGERASARTTRVYASSARAYFEGSGRSLLED